jgi:hypothetical protein
MDQKTGCWLWLGTKNGSGYGTIGLGPAVAGKDFVHRVAYRLLNGPIPTGKLVCHRCDVRLCCNPEHLFLGTYLDNSRDAKAKGRTPIGDRWPTAAREAAKPVGERHGHAKLTEEQVREIIRLGAREGLTRAEISRRFKVSRATVRNIVTGKNWRHLQESTHATMA